jgi:hypothetical protein
MDVHLALFHEVHRT